MNNENPNFGASPSPSYPQSKVKPSLIVSILAVLVALALAGGSAAWALNNKSLADETKVKLLKQEDESKKLQKELEERKVTTGEENIDKEVFQAVFLHSGQVYFGKITKLTETQLTLENIYYLSTESGSKDINSLGDGPGGLIKLGKELHGPEDQMFIERLQLDFYENLKPDGQVSKAIKDYEATNL